MEFQQGEHFESESFAWHYSRVQSQCDFAFCHRCLLPGTVFKELRDTATVNGITAATLNRNAKSQRSIHFIAGFDYRFKMKERLYKFTAEAYYKALSNIVPYTVDNVKIVYDASRQCSGHAAGLDLKLYGEFVPGTDSWVSLSLMDAKMDINGKSIPMPTDQRYALNLFSPTISPAQPVGACR